MKVAATDLAWLAGIVDGEGCFSVKRNHGASKSAHMVCLVLCNTSRPMIDRAVAIMDQLGVKHGSIRKVWKGVKATRWQYWVDVMSKHHMLRLTEALLPHLTAKKVEAEVVLWFLRRQCSARFYRQTQLDQVVLNTLSVVKRNGGEAPVEVRAVLGEVIPSQAVSGVQATGNEAEGVEARSVTSKENPTQECPATLLRLVAQG